MQNKNKFKFSAFNSGFSLVEVLLTIALFAIFVTTFSGAFVNGQESERLSGDRARAIFLAEEGLEIVRNMRDQDFSNLIAGTHGLAISNGAWIFSGAFDSNGIFTREIVVTDISASEKKIISNVTWKQNNQKDGLISLESYLNNWKVFNPTEAEQLLVDTSNSEIMSGGVFQVSGINIENIGIENISIASMQTQWSGVSSGAKLTEINIDGNIVWTGSDNSGGAQDISDFILTLGAGNYPLVFVFDKPINNISLIVTFLMTDGSTKEIIFTPGSPVDTTAPANINDLAVSGPTTTTLNLSWTAPGDDGLVGVATAYDIRYSNAIITDGNWSSAIQITGEPTPTNAGDTQNMTVSGLSPGTTYYFAIKTLDEVSNSSGLSNVANNTTNALPQANYLIVNTAGALLSANKRDILGITLQNSGPSNLVISSITVSWSGVAASRRITFIRINGTTVWTGAAASGAINDINPDVVLSNAGGIVPVNYLRFNNSISGITLSLTFNMLDGSTKTVSGIGPLL